jgi:hypothetical protein
LSYSADNSKNSDSEEGEDRTVMNGMIETITQDLSLHLQIPTVHSFQTLKLKFYLIA